MLLLTYLGLAREKFRQKFLEIVKQSHMFPVMVTMEFGEKLIEKQCSGLSVIKLWKQAELEYKTMREEGNARAFFTG
jgi:cell division protein FtsB